MTELVRKLCALRGASGNEDAVREAIIEEIRDHCTYEVDALGNLIAYKKGARPARKKLLLSAHMDEVGFIITAVESDGLLRFSPVGGIDPAVVVGKHVLVGEKEIHGVVGIKPIHLCEKDERDTVPKMTDLSIDIGARDAEEARKAVCVGDYAVFDSPVRPLGDGFLCGRALDDRAGCAVLIELIRSPLPADCVFAFTVQEETGCTGGKTAAYTVEPEIGIVVETTTAGDLPGSEVPVCKLGNGPVVSFMDRGTVYTRELYRAALDTAAEKGIPCQVKEGVSGGNESRSVQGARAGAQVLAVSAPCRYLHSPSCLLKSSDLEAMPRLLSALMERFAL